MLLLADSSSPKEKGKAAKGKQEAEKPASNLTRLLESTSHGGPADYVVAPQGLFPAPLSETNSKAGGRAFWLHNTMLEHLMVILEISSCLSS